MIWWKPLLPFQQCKIEWFHFGCVGLKEQPKGKWYCSDCAVLKNRRKGRWCWEAIFGHSIICICNTIIWNRVIFFFFFTGSVYIQLYFIYLCNNSICFWPCLVCHSSIISFKRTYAGSSLFLFYFLRERERERERERAFKWFNRLDVFWDLTEVWWLRLFELIFHLFVF